MDHQGHCQWLVSVLPLTLHSLVTTRRRGRHFSKNPLPLGAPAPS